eukprot:jgi/Chlat1/6999/Chrsp56S06681
MCKRLLVLSAAAVLRGTKSAAAGCRRVSSLSSWPWPRSAVALAAAAAGVSVPVGLAAGVMGRSSALAEGRAEDGIADNHAAIVREFMVDMTCDSCVSAVKAALEPIPGVSSVDVDLSAQTVRVTGTSTLPRLVDAVSSTGRVAQLIGIGSSSPQDFPGVSAAVAEFKGPSLFGVARMTQLAGDLAHVEITLDGLQPNRRHAVALHEYGDLTQGPSSTGRRYNPTGAAYGSLEGESRRAGDWGDLVADETGRAHRVHIDRHLQVWDVIGRAVVVYGIADSADCEERGERVAAAVVARSSGIGGNPKKLCSCDGTTIWDAGPDRVTPTQYSNM